MPLGNVGLKAVVDAILNINTSNVNAYDEVQGNLQIINYTNGGTNLSLATGDQDFPNTFAYPTAVNGLPLGTSCVIRHFCCTSYIVFPISAGLNTYPSLYCKFGAGQNISTNGGFDNINTIMLLGTITSINAVGSNYVITQNLVYTGNINPIRDQNINVAGSNGVFVLGYRRINGSFNGGLPTLNNLEYGYRVSCHFTSE